MKAALVVSVLLVASPALADDAGPWLGTWSGKASSKGCAQKAPARVVLEIAQTREGGLRSNGDVLIEGFGDLDWTAAKKKLTLAHAGMTGSVSLKKKTATLVLATDGGCKVRATLRRTKKGAPPVVVSTSGIPACDRYIELVERYIQCAKVPQAARDAARQGIDAIKQGWQNMAGASDEAKQQADDACKQANDALKQGANALGCTI